MSFQFCCPNGHLLEADHSQAGQTCVCPHCQLSLVIPGPATSALANDAAMQPAAPPAPALAAAQPPPVQHDDQANAAPEIYPDLAVGEVRRTSPAVSVGPDQGNEQLLHIPCPNGHVLDTPVEMLGDDVLCPHCETQFRLLRRNSIEHQRQQAVEEARKERRANKFWLNVAITAAILFLFGLLLLAMTSC